MLQLSTKAVKSTSTKKRLSHAQLKEAKQSTRGKKWQRVTQKRNHTESVDA